MANVLKSQSALITWAVSNLLSNALRYTPSGGHVDIEATGDDGGVRLAVSDTGPGIRADILPRHFEPIVTSQSAGVGLGLGLLIS